MKLKISAIILCLSAFLVQPLSAQNIYTINEKVVNMMDNVAYLKSLSPQLAEEYEGSPYENDNFRKGKVYYGKKWLYDDVPLRYNIYTDQMEFLLEEKDQIYALVPDKQIEKIELADKVFVVGESPAGAKTENGFYKQIATGKIDLLVKLDVYFKEKEPYKGFVEPKPAQFIRRNDIFFLRKEHEQVLRVGSIKKMISYIGNHQDHLQNFAKKEKIKTGVEEDLIKFVNYYNSLVETDNGNADTGL
jgi:hypothetical protein